MAGDVTERGGMHKGWPTGAPEPERPAEPANGDTEVWYRGWECGLNDAAEYWTGEGWEAYKGGVDLDAPKVTGKSWSELLDAVDEAEDA